MSETNASELSSCEETPALEPIDLRAWKWIVRLAALGVWLEFAGILLLSLVPGSERPHTGLGSGQIEHALAYGIAGATVSLGYRTTRARLFALSPFALGCGVFELMQNLVPDRSPQLIDAFASLGGLCAGFTAGALVSAVMEGRRRR